MKIKTTILKGDSFSVDIKEQYIKAKKYILRDKYFKKYKQKKWETFFKKFIIILKRAYLSTIKFLKVNTGKKV